MLAGVMSFSTFALPLGEGADELLNGSLALLTDRFEIDRGLKRGIRLCDPLQGGLRDPLKLELG